MSGYNPFVNTDLRFPKAYFDEVKRFCQTRPEGGRKARIADAPFPRYVDLWFLAVCVGAANSVRLPEDPASGWQSFITGAEGLNSDPWRVDMLELLAIAAADDTSVIGQPRQVLDVANRYASVGTPVVLDWLKSGQSTSIDNLLDRVREAMPASATPVGEVAESAM